MPKSYLSRQIQGASIHDQTGCKLGRVHEVVFDRGNGQATHAVLSSGGFRGMGTKYRRAPWGNLAPIAD